MKAFTAALESLGKDRFSIGKIPPTPGLVDEYFNDSTGVGDEGEADARGPWNEGGKWKIVEAPELEEGVEARHGKTVAKSNKHANRNFPVVRNSISGATSSTNELPISAPSHITAHRDLRSFYQQKT